MVIVSYIRMRSGQEGSRMGTSPSKHEKWLRERNLLDSDSDILSRTGSEENFQRIHDVKDTFRLEPQMEVLVVEERKKSVSIQTSKPTTKNVICETEYNPHLFDKVFEFKDDEGIWRGPYKEEELQQWYRQGYFTSQHIFRFKGRNEEVDLEQLMVWNGCYAPFSMTFADADFNDRMKILSLINLEKAIKRHHRTAKLIEQQQQGGYEMRIAELESEVAQLRAKQPRNDMRSFYFSPPCHLIPMLCCVYLPVEAGMFITTENELQSYINELRELFIKCTVADFERTCKTFFKPVKCYECNTSVFNTAIRLFAHITSKGHREKLWKNDSGISYNDIFFWRKVLNQCKGKDEQKDMRLILEESDKLWESNKKNDRVELKEFSPTKDTTPKAPISQLPNINMASACTLPLFSIYDDRLSKKLLTRDNSVNRMAKARKFIDTLDRVKCEAELKSLIGGKQTTCRFCAVKLSGTFPYLDHAMSSRHVNMVYDCGYGFLTADVEFWEKILERSQKVKKSVSPIQMAPVDPRRNANSNSKKESSSLPTEKTLQINDVSKLDLIKKVPEGMKICYGIAFGVCRNDVNALCKYDYKTAVKNVEILRKRAQNLTKKDMPHILPDLGQTYCTHCELKMNNGIGVAAHCLQIRHITKLLEALNSIFSCRKFTNMYTNGYIITAADFKDWDLMLSKASR